MSDETKPVNLELQLDDETAQGLYANLALVAHTDGEFTMDFVFVQPHQPRGKVRARIITSPRHAARLVAALQENIARYEARYGPITPPAPDLH